MTLATTLNFSSTTPAAESGYLNVKPQNDAGVPTCNQSFEVAIATTSQLGVVQPDGTTVSITDGVISVSGSGLGTFLDEIVAFTGTAGHFAHTPTILVGLFKNGVRLTKLTGSPDFSVAGGVNITLTTAATGGDVYEAVYWY